jgi:hypothetical protein
MPVLRLILCGGSRFFWPTPLSEPQWSQWPRSGAGGRSCGGFDNSCDTGTGTASRGHLSIQATLGVFNLCSLQGEDLPTEPGKFSPHRFADA